MKTVRIGPGEYRYPGAMCRTCRRRFLARKPSQVWCSRQCYVDRPIDGRFWRRVRQTANCWEWTGQLMTSGYGALSVQGRRQGAHRVSWELHHGPVPSDLWVLHRCDNRACVRPDHLFLGTPLDNMRDMAAKGRHRNGPTPMACPRGHDYAEFGRRPGARQTLTCVLCSRERGRLYARQKRAALRQAAIDEALGVTA